MLAHNPECTNGTAHPYTVCRDRYSRPLKMVEVPDPVAEEPQASNPVVLGSQLTPEEQETLAAALRAANQPEPALEETARIFGGLVVPSGSPDVLPGINRMDLSAHDPHRDPDADADAAQRVD